MRKRDLHSSSGGVGMSRGLINISSLLGNKILWAETRTNNDLMWCGFPPLPSLYHGVLATVPTPNNMKVMSRQLLPLSPLRKQINKIRRTLGDTRQSSFLLHIRNIFNYSSASLRFTSSSTTWRAHKSQGRGNPWYEAQSKRFYSTTPLNKLEVHTGPWEKVFLAYALKESYSALPPQGVPIYEGPLKRKAPWMNDYS